MFNINSVQILNYADIIIRTKKYQCDPALISSYRTMRMFKKTLLNAKPTLGMVYTPMRRSIDCGKDVLPHAVPPVLLHF
jgi:hypothetical protein